MRLISQDGMSGIYDLPYNKCLVYIYGDKKTIKVQPLGEFDSEYVFATYSTEAKALKVMDMLREQYQHGKKIAVPKLEENGIAKDDVMLFNTRLTNDFFKGGTYLPVKVFKFPADEEVEV